MVNKIFRIVLSDVGWVILRGVAGPYPFFWQKLNLGIFQNSVCME